MNIYKKICKQFAFLQDLNFKRVEFWGAECEVQYVGENNTVSVLSYKGIDETYRQRECIDIIISTHTTRENILKSSFFDPQDINYLNKTLEAKSVSEQIEIYAKFLKDNIKALTH